MLDLPELFAPARTVRGAMSMLLAFAIDLKPDTVIRVIPVRDARLRGRSAVCDKPPVGAGDPADDGKRVATLGSLKHSMAHGTVSLSRIRPNPRPLRYFEVARPSPEGRAFAEATHRVRR